MFLNRLMGTAGLPVGTAHPTASRPGLRQLNHAIAMQKVTDFEFFLPETAEKIEFWDLTEEEKIALSLGEEPTDRAIYRISVIVQHLRERRVKRKYRWQSLQGVAFGIDLQTTGVRFAGGLFPRRDHRDLHSNLSVQFNALPTSRFVTAKIASQLSRSIPGDNWGVYAQRTDRSARWMLTPRWITQNDLTQFMVLCSVPSTVKTDILARCYLVGFRANAERLARKNRVVCLPR